ncbi:MAG: DUF805 domain-containing protein [Bacteroidota bacterium]|nr:DUF805 domain-containing protein [Bacteroidota bacterium]
MEWYLKVMKENYANFSGRARRKEYWMFTLIQMFVLIGVMILDTVFGTNGVVYMIAVLAHIIPGIAASVRRLHDVGKSGWFLLISFVPIIGAIWLLVLACTDRDSGDNAYGESPKAA